MKNKRYYPFERNNYFYGKLLTVRDFEDEQRYMNDKRRINNFLTTGSGVISGLSVVELNEKTISLEAGMALDYMGREILVEESVTKKLNVIDGFENIQDYGNVYLCLEYMENSVESVHSITAGSQNEQDKNNDYNRIKEGYHLFLTDSVSDEELLTPYFLIEQKQVIYSSNGIKITQVMPKYAKKKENIDLKIIIEKINLPRMIEIDYKLNLTNIKTTDGENELRIYYKDEDITAYKSTELTYKLNADDVKNVKGYFEVSDEKGRVTVGSVNYSIEKTGLAAIEITRKDVFEKVIENYMSRHFDDVLTIGSENCIYLAKMRLIKQGNEYSIEAFETMPFKQYILNNTMLAMFLDKKKSEIILSEKNTHTSEKILEKQDSSMNLDEFFSSGEEYIEVDIRSKNKSYFSEEIAHGLGKGDVMLTLAVEDVSDDTMFELKKSVFGDINVFKGSSFEPTISSISTGVISYTERGTFRIGIKFFEDGLVPVVKVKWWAYKNNNKNERSAVEINSVEVRIEPNTISVSPREKCKFEAIVTGTDSKECRWSVTDANGGQIDINGIYDAPSREGVYEITAESVKYPNKKATAFVVVKEK